MTKTISIRCPASSSDNPKAAPRTKIGNLKLVWLSVVAVVFVVTGAVAMAQQTGKIPRVGFLDPSNASGMAVLLDTFRQELRKLGWVEGENITIEYRFAEQKNERLPELAAELVRLKVDLIVASGGAPAFPAKKATTTIPIVMANFPDPVGEGLVASLARPGGNVTGLSNLAFELNTKGWRYLRTRSPSSPELDFCGRRKVDQ
jgi:ABC-type uncharacterized transport system substrate-binding protein